MNSLIWLSVIMVLASIWAVVIWLVARRFHAAQTDLESQNRRAETSKRITDAIDNSKTGDGAGADWHQRLLREQAKRGRDL